MASSSFHLLPSSSYPPPQWRYEVFVSFRGDDTRKNIVDHLFDALKRNGIYAFRDQKLDRGKVIGPELFKAIEESRISIIVFSKTYASSTWCLDELVKILECRNKLGQVVVPVFYDVDPSDVRKLAGSFEEAFSKHEEAFRDDIEKVHRWREATIEAGNLSGFHLQDRHESKFIREIVKEILSKLSPTLSSTIGEFVGLDWRLKELSSHVGLGSADIRFIGIHGMGGIGKTTLAKFIYHHMSIYFDGSSFLANVREISEEGRLVSLQEQLLSQILKDGSFRIWNVHHGIDMIRSRLCHRKVLVIIDDVDDVNQLGKLAGNRNWFGLGSRVIVTTRDEHVLALLGADIIYKVECLNHEEALQLLSLKAFKTDNPPDEYLELCEHVIGYADGLPLALEVLGSFLRGRSIDEWIGALERLKEDSDKKIIDRLQISFEGLEESEKSIFLDIAFFFKWKSKEYITKIMDSCGFHPAIGLKVLIERCLIFVSEIGRISMHDLLQEMAKKIVKKEFTKEPEKRSRLSNGAEVGHVLVENKGTEAIEGIMHEFSEEEKMALSAEAFFHMKNLRVLKISNVQLPQGLAYLPKELRFLEWRRYPLKYLPSTFEPENIVVLNLCNSLIQRLWKGMKVLNKLKFLDLSYSENLTKTPDFTGIPNLESLTLEGCRSLSEVHPSILDLSRLTMLNLRGCISLVNLPDFNNLESLTVCCFAGCSKLKNFPKVKREGSFGWPSLTCLCSLTKLNLSDCNIMDGAILSDLYHLSSLRDLNLSRNSFVSLPSSLSKLLNLKLLVVNECQQLESLPKFSAKLKYIDACRCPSLVEMPSDAASLRSSASYSFNGLNCFKLEGGEGSAVLFAMLKRFLQGSSNKEFFELCLPTSEIPEWCTNQSQGLSVSVDIPVFPHDNDNNGEFFGVLAGCIFSVDEHSPDPQSWGDYKMLNYTHQLLLHMEGSSSRPWFFFGEEMGRAIKDHLWLVFLCQASECLEGTLFSRENEKDEFLSEEDDQRFRISFSEHGPGIKVKKCGIRLVYKPDVEELKQTISQLDAAIF